MKSFGYLFRSFALLLVAFGVTFAVLHYTQKAADFDSFQGSAGKGGFSAAEKGKVDGVNTIVFKELKLYVMLEDVAYTCEGELKVSVKDDDAGKSLMKYRYDVVNYATAALSQQSDFSEESLKKAATQIAESYKQDRRMADAGEFTFNSLTCTKAE
jgi:hypothetical protein